MEMGRLTPAHRRAPAAIVTGRGRTWGYGLALALGAALPLGAGDGLGEGLG